MRFADDLRDSDAPLQDADASKLLRDLCGDMYVDAAQLDNFVSLSAALCQKKPTTLASPAVSGLLTTFL